MTKIFTKNQICKDMKGEHKDEGGFCGGGAGGAVPKCQKKRKRQRGVPMNIETGLSRFEIFKVN